MSTSLSRGFPGCRWDGSARGSRAAEGRRQAGRRQQPAKTPGNQATNLSRAKLDARGRSKPHRVVRVNATSPVFALV